MELIETHPLVSSDSIVNDLPQGRQNLFFFESQIIFFKTPRPSDLTEAFFLLLYTPTISHGVHTHS